MPQPEPRNSAGVDLSGSPITQVLRGGVFPEWWTFVPVAGKATYLKEWAEKPLPRERLVEEYRSKPAYRGLGVVTGEFSGGLIALDIDGADADSRYKQAAEDAYEALGAETTMSWTSGKPGRRQVLYRVPAELVPQLRHVKTVILGFDGTWYLGKGDMARAGGFTPPPEALGEGAAPALDQEVVLRFNKCQSVVPGSPHPETGLYEWLNYNHGQVEMAPQWVLDVLRQFRKPLRWLSEEDLLALDQELGETLLPEKQIRGWFFKEEIQQMLMPRLEDLVFRHQAFEHYGWRTRGGSNPQRMSGCPWHGGTSGTSFQYSTISGCWDCKACGVGGDVLDFLHKARLDDRFAPRPRGPQLETYVAEIASGLGLDYPACAEIKEVRTREIPKTRLSARELLERAKQILKEYRNPAEQKIAFMDLAEDSGRYRLDATSLRNMALRDTLFLGSKENGCLQDNGWSELVDPEDFVIPGLMRSPCQVMLHAKGGVGKSEMALALAKAVGRGESMQVRGASQPIKQGTVLWFSGDQGKSRLASMLFRQGIEEAGRDRDWFRLVCGWKVDMHEEFRELVQRFRPALIVMDSLGTMLEGIAKEKDGEYADWIYQLTNLNGDETVPGGFPATSIVWIHHNTKNDENFRGSDRLANAMDEVWSLRLPTEEEEAELGVNTRILTIGKSRFDRGNDRLIIRRDLEFNYSISDMTPLIQKEGINRNGMSTPETLVLALLTASEAPMDRQTLKEALHARMRGEGRRENEMPTDYGVRKYVDRWLTDGLVVEVEMPASGRGRPKKGYLSRGKYIFSLAKNGETGLDPLPAEASRFFVSCDETQPLAKNPAKNPPTPPEGVESGDLTGTGVTLDAAGIFASDLPEGEVSQKIIAENPCPDWAAEDGGFFASEKVLYRRSTPDLTTTGTPAGLPHEQPSDDHGASASPLGGGGSQVASAASSEGPGAEPSHSGTDQSSTETVLERVRLARQMEPEAVPQLASGSDEASSQQHAPSVSGVELASACDKGGVPAAHQELCRETPLGGPVSQSDLDGGTPQGCSEAEAPHLRQAPDHAAVPQPAQAQAGESQGVVGTGTPEGETQPRPSVLGDSWTWVDPWDDPEWNAVRWG